MNNIRKIREVCIISGGYAFKSKEFTDEGTPVIRIGDINDNKVIINSGTAFIKEYNEKVNKFIIKKGDVLIALSGATTGKFGIYNYDMPALLNQRVAKISPSKNIDNRYLYHYINMLQDIIYNKAVGCAQPNISPSELGEIDIYVPELPEQLKISEVLDVVKEMIDKRKEAIDLLNELVKSKFIEMFGNPATNPKSWEITTIGKVTTDVRYGTSKPAVEGGKYPYLRMNNITYSGYLDLDNLKYIDIEDNELEKCVVRKGDVLFNRTNSAELIGKTCVFDLEEPMIIAGYIIRIRLIDEVLPIYLSMFLNSDYGKGLLRGMAKGAVNQANINAQELKSIKIAVPPIELQNQFADFVKQVDKLKFEMEKSLKELEDNFNSLMQKAFKGELFN